jgi:hypothetical protein
MPALPSLETVGRGGLTPSAGMMIDEALFADPLLAADWRAVAFVAAPPATSARMLAATSRAGGWLVVYAGVGFGLAAANNAAESPRRSFGLDESRILVVLAGATTAPFRIDAAAETGAVAAGQRVMTARGDVARKAAPSDSTAFAVAAAGGARRRHAGVLAVPHCLGSPLLSDAGAMILLENSEEALRGAAGAAQKAALDIISSSKGANDLKADNAKLGVRMRNRRRHQLGQGQIGYPDRLRCRQRARSRYMAHGRGRTDDEAVRRAANRRINKRRQPERGRVA